jgi:hypothetical protein
MSHWQLGHREEARRWYARADEWIDKNKERIDEEMRLRRKLVADVRSFRVEAAVLMGIKNK